WQLPLPVRFWPCCGWYKSTAKRRLKAFSHSLLIQHNGIMRPNISKEGRMHVLIILNPTSGSAKPQTIYQMRQALLAAGAEVTLYTTTAAGDATRYLQNYSAPLDVVAVAGGDGTLNEVVNGLAGHPNDSFRLALIPMGTTNVLAYELGIKRKNAI